MSVTVEAIYRKDGTLHLLEPLALEDEQRVSLTIETSAAETSTRLNGGFSSSKVPNPQHVAELLKELSALVEPTGEVETGSQDHDHYLYGAPKQSERAGM